jgi:hypothetical protein
VGECNRKERGGGAEEGRVSERMPRSSAWLARALLSLAVILSILACFAVAVEVQERKWGSSTSHRAGVTGAAAQQVQRLRGGKTTLRDQKRAAKHKLKREVS